MHELAVTQSVLDIAIKHARQAGASRISQINLVIGEMSGILDESVQFYLDFLSKDTMAEGAKLVFDRRPAVYHCQECDRTFTPDDLNWTCPSCGALAFDKKKQGRGLRWLLPRAIGQVEIVEHVPLHVLTSVLQSMGARGKR